MLVALLVFNLWQSTPQRPVTIWVGPQVRDGFVDVDQGVTDAIKDVQRELRDSNRVAVVEKPEHATILVRIVGRRYSGDAGAVGITTGSTVTGGSTIAGVTQPAYVTPGVTTTIAMQRRTIDAVLAVGAYEKILASEDATYDTWRGAAKQLAKDVLAWLAANRDRLTQR